MNGGGPPGRVGPSSHMPTTSSAIAQALVTLTILPLRAAWTQYRPIDRILKSLQERGHIKQFKNIHKKTHAYYILSHLEPDRTLTGRPWYTEKFEFDRAFVGAFLNTVKGAVAMVSYTNERGATPQTVTGISSPSAARAELHESRQVGGLMKMAPLPRLAVAKGQMVMFQPGGKHVMLFGLDPKVKAGGTVRLDLKLADGSTASVDAKAVSAADGAPAGMSHDHKH